MLYPPKAYLMQIIAYSKVRACLAKSMDQVINDRMPLLVIRRSADPVVMISLADYCAMMKTAEAVSAPAVAMP